MKKHNKIFRITESELRAWQKCSALFSFGADVETSLKTNLTEYVYSKLIIDLLRTPDFDYKYFLNSHLHHARKYLKLDEVISNEEALQELLRHAAININEIFNILKPTRYIPAFGSFEYPVKIANGIIDLRVASLLVTNSEHSYADKGGRTFHAVAFSPHAQDRDMEQDFTQILKVTTLVTANPLLHYSPTMPFKLHLFSSKISHGINYTFIEYNKDMHKHAKYFEEVFGLIEKGFNHPLSPCPHACQFKPICGVDHKRIRRLNYDKSMGK